MSKTELDQSSETFFIVYPSEDIIGLFNSVLWPFKYFSSFLSWEVTTYFVPAANSVFPVTTILIAKMVASVHIRPCINDFQTTDNLKSFWRNWRIPIIFMSHHDIQKIKSFSRLNSARNIDVWNDGILCSFHPAIKIISELSLFTIFIMQSLFHKKHSYLW
jgi:hypothetical protein